MSYAKIGVIPDVEDPYRVYLVVEHQSFRLGVDVETKEEADWFVKMLDIAVKRIEIAVLERGVSIEVLKRELELLRS